MILLYWYLMMVLFEGVCSKLTSSWPPAREVGLGTAALAPLCADPGVAADEFREVIFYAQVHANRHICSELGVQFSTNLRK